MKQPEDKDLQEKCSRRDGLTVPEGYFADFASKMAAKLPERPELEDPATIARAAQPRTLWHRIRPYSYMAAMFAGVWCMLKMFTLMSHTDEMTIDNNPTLASAVDNPQFIDEYFIDDVNQWELYDSLMADSIDVQMLEADSTAFAATMTRQ